MTTKPEAIAQIEAALAAGPKEGPWIAAGPSFGAALPKYLNEVVVDRERDDDDTYLVCGCPLGLDDYPESGTTLDYIAACNPTAMREVLDHIEAQKAEIERLRGAPQQALDVLLAAEAEREACAKVLDDAVVRLSACPESQGNLAAVSTLIYQSQQIRNRANPKSKK